MLLLNSANFRSRSAAVLCSMMVWAFAEFLAPARAWAHKVNLFAYVEGDTVITESYFSDGRKCRDSTIEVFDAQGKKLIKGKTDIEGAFSFRPPVRSNLLIRLTASTGHRAEYTVAANELPEGLSAVEPAGTPIQAVTDAADIEQAVDRALARQLIPIRRALEESRARRRFSDIVGGIGYIMGLMGLVLYFRSRQRQR